MASDPFLPALTPQSTVAELPTWNVRLPVSARGDDFDAVLRRHPELPGVVVVEGQSVRGAISRARFQQVISRPFGGEIVRPRAIGALFDDLAAGLPAILDVRTPVQEALRVALTREQEMLYEPVLVDAGEEVRLLGFTDLLRADSRISALRNQQMQEILATVQEGFLLVDREHRIDSEYSRSVETILGVTHLAGRRLPEVLDSLLGTELAELGGHYLDTLFNANVIERLAGDINPLRSVRTLERAGHARKHLGFAFKRSMEGREIRRVLVRVEDRTREVELAADLEEQERQAGERVDLALDMMQVEPHALTDYLTRFLAEVPRVARLLAGSDDPRAAIDAVFRILHSLKGEAGLIGLRTFAQRLHRTEDVAATLRANGSLHAAELRRLDPWVESLRALGTASKELVARLSALASHRAPERIESPPAPPPDLVASIETLVAELASRLGKQARFVATWKSAELPPRYAGVVREALIQLARNAMVHGIESEAERRANGKPAQAMLQCALRRHEAERQLEVVFQDDGRGLDLARIRSKARERFGIEAEGDAEAAQLIFQPGFSTAEETSADAGRGVGLDLVRERVEALGGAIFVHHEPRVYCAFQLVLPLDEEGADATADRR